MQGYGRQDEGRLVGVSESSGAPSGTGVEGPERPGARSKLKHALATGSPGQEQES